MVTGRNLRLALFGLLLFMVFCLVALELSLRDKWPTLTRRLHADSPLSLNPLFLNSSTLTKVSLVNYTQGHSQPSSFHISTRNVTVPSISKVSSALGHLINSSREFINSSRGLISSLNSSITTPSVLIHDFCKFENQSNGENGTFDLQAQKTANGSRPVNCTKCFYSRFPALLQSCGVCNTGAGKEKEVVMVMMILTSHGGADRRQAVRETWASITRNNTAHVRHVFLLGRTKNERHMKEVEEEHRRYRDLVVYDFLDTYANLTLKTLTGLHWVTQYCSNARLLLKADDDMWMNIPAVLDTAQKNDNTLQAAIGGSCRFNSGPIRNSRSKWYASKLSYPQNSYPGFCSGTSYVTSVNVARHIISVSPDVPFFHLEDVYMALCIQKLGRPFKLHGLAGFFHGQAASPCATRNKSKLSVHGVSPAGLRRIWSARC